MSASIAARADFSPGSLVRARGREWVVLPKTSGDRLWVRPLGGVEDDATLIYLPLEREAPRPATFPPPNPEMNSDQAAALLLRDALTLKLRAGAGPFRSLGNITVEPRAYQLVPLLMALKQDTVRLLIGDDVGIGKTIEAGLIARELLDRGEIDKLTVLCPPHLCDQWQDELASKFAIQAEVVRTGTASRLERGLPPNVSIFDVHPFTVVSLDYIKMKTRRDEFLRACPDFVIVEEAHSCVGAGAGSRTQRLDLLRGLAKKDDRHIVFLTATPHSGDETAFHNLLGLLDPAFTQLQSMPDGTARRQLREQLAQHFVQRRREDIKEWRDEGSVFPDRETSEASYALTGEWGHLFDGVLDYARTLVKRTENQSLLRQRMSWWAALALLRCVSSSPASAAVALETRLRAVEGMQEAEQIAELDVRGAEAVFDGEATDELTTEESAPAGITDDGLMTDEDRAKLERLLGQARALRGVARDPKVKLVVGQVERMLKDGFRPVVFCRYIQTAHYVAEQLREALGEKKYLVTVVTGELPPEERRHRIDGLSEAAEDRIPVLVATDCLSEGINLQSLFSAVIHYDLSWNPTRHEQREGRVDRFGQAAKTVRALMIYGSNNPVDGAVLKVITRKAERIRKDLGVAVPVPMDTNKVTEAILRVVLLQTGGVADGLKQGRFEFMEERELDLAWESAKENAKQNRTIFAQNTLKPDAVLPEWRKAIAALGGEEDVRRFVRSACQRLGAPLEAFSEGRYKLPAANLPPAVVEQLEAARIPSKALRVAFRHPAPAGFEAVHRTHPLVVALADHVAERALAEDKPDLASRCGALATTAVKTRTTVLLLRLRAQIGLDRVEGGRRSRLRTLLAEEAVAVALEGSAAPRALEPQEALALMAAQPARNMEPDEKAFEVQDSLDTVARLTTEFEAFARSRAQTLLEDHTRVRDASRQKGLAYAVEPCLPADIIGCFVLVPV
ncbi:MAG: DEAD/DEAH box helicase [Fimbriimonadaceae bacterium]|nr:DEAD/DEAH box helicase [Fimbriimonadaceae bacterium]